MDLRQHVRMRSDLTGALMLNKSAGSSVCTAQSSHRHGPACTLTGMYVTEYCRRQQQQQTHTGQTVRQQ